MDQFSTKDAITLAIATVGAVLGIINTWKAISKDRPKLKVVPKQAFRTDGTYIDKDARLCIEVTNLSTFALTVTEVGVIYDKKGLRGSIIRPTLSAGGTLPHRLEPRSSLTAYAEHGALDNGRHAVRCAYAATDCGLTFKGNSRALKQLAHDARTLP